MHAALGGTLHPTYLPGAGFGYVSCSSTDECPEWNGAACFYDGSSDNFKVCGSKPECPAAAATPARRLFGLRRMG